MPTTDSYLQEQPGALRLGATLGADQHACGEERELVGGATLARIGALIQRQRRLEHLHELLRLRLRRR